MKKLLSILAFLAFTIISYAQERPGYAFIRAQTDLLLDYTYSGNAYGIRPSTTTMNVGMGVGYRISPQIAVAVGFGGYRGLKEQFPSKIWKENKGNGGTFFTNARFNMIQSWSITPVIDAELGWNFMSGPPDSKQMHDNKYEDYISAYDKNIVYSYKGPYAKFGIGWKFPLFNTEIIAKFCVAVYDTFIGGQSGQITKDYCIPITGVNIYLPGKPVFKDRLKTTVGLSLEVNI